MTREFVDRLIEYLACREHLDASRIGSKDHEILVAQEEAAREALYALCEPAGPLVYDVTQQVWRYRPETS